LPTPAVSLRRSKREDKHQANWGSIQTC